MEGDARLPSIGTQPTQKHKQSVETHRNVGDRIEPLDRHHADAKSVPKALTQQRGKSRETTTSM